MREPGEMTSTQKIRFVGVLAIAGLIAVVAATCASCARSAVPEAPATMERPAVARLQILDGAGKKLGTCTAWKYSETLAVTAGHCCDPSFYYYLEGPSSIPGRPTTMLVDDDDHDVCVLGASMLGTRVVLAQQDPAVGERVWSLGYPRGTFTITDGYWSGRDEDGDGTCSIDAVGGMSGSPVLDTRGHGIGVLNKGYLGFGVTFVVPLEYLRIDLMRAYQLSMRLP